MLERIVMGLKSVADRVAYALTPAVEELIPRAGYRRLDAIANIQAAYRRFDADYLRSLPPDLQEVLPAFAAYNWYVRIGIVSARTNQNTDDQISIEDPNIREWINKKAISSEREWELITKWQPLDYDFRAFFNPVRQEAIISAVPIDRRLHPFYFWGPWREGENALVKRVFLEYISRYIEHGHELYMIFVREDYSPNCYRSVNCIWQNIMWKMANGLKMNAVSPMTVDPLKKKLLDDIKQNKAGSAASQEQKAAPVESIDCKVDLSALKDEALDLTWQLIGLSDALRQRYRIVDNRRWYHKLPGIGRQKTVKDILQEKRQGLEKRINKFYLSARGTPYETMAVAFREDLVSKDQIEKDFEGPDTKLKNGQTIEFGTVTNLEDRALEDIE